jgi:uncharacterized alkaline shock family protein YloU
MTSLAAPAATPQTSTAVTSVGEAADPVLPRRRGRLVLAVKVIEKVAGQAATEVSVTSGRVGGLFGFGTDADPKARPHVEVALSEDSADLALAVGIAYPGSLRAATDRVRSHVVERVEELTGVDVRRVDIDVTFLTPDPATSRKALR